MYVQVPVPEEEVFAVFEFLLTRPAPRAADLTTEPEPAVKPSAVEDNEENADETAAIWYAVNDDARAVLVSIARMRGTRPFMKDLEDDSGVANVGAAMMSIASQCKKLGLAWPIERRRDSRTNKIRYSARTEVADRILGLAAEEKGA